jgi:predicted Fe-S protein YdhL (DUF1289 family)
VKQGSDLDETLKEKWENLSEGERHTYFELCEDMVKIAKRAKSYMHFSNNQEIRNKIKTDHSDWSVTQIAIELGKQWKQLSEKERQKWVDLSNKEKEDLLKTPIYIFKKKKKLASSKKNSIGQRMDELEKIINQLQNDIIEIKHKLDN